MWHRMRRRVLKVSVRRQLALFALDVSIAVDAGILVLFGPSGAGKSMLLRTIAGIERVDAGQIELGGRLLLDTSLGINLDSRQRRVGYVPQQYALFPHLSAVDNVAYPMVAGRGVRRSEARKRARELLDMVGIADRADAPPARLSGGQQQRVAIARAVSADSEVLLLDEPLAALDAPTRRELRDLLRQMQRELAVPVIFVTHDLEEAVSVGTTMAVMIEGRLRQLDAVARVLDAPADRLVADLVQARNVLPGMLECDGAGPVVVTAIGRLRAAASQRSGPVDVIIRPDLLRLSQTATCNGRDTVLDGTVIDLVDYGTRATVTLAVGDGRLEAGVTRGDVRRLGIGRGDRLQCVVPADAVHVVDRLDGAVSPSV